MATVTITAENIEKIISENDVVILDFWASWCGPCRNFAPVFEAASEAHPNVVFGKIDTQEQQALAQQLQIRSIPTIMVFREQIQMYSQPGALPAARSTSCSPTCSLSTWRTSASKSPTATPTPHPPSS